MLAAWLRGCIDWKADASANIITSLNKPQLSTVSAVSSLSCVLSGTQFIIITQHFSHTVHTLCNKPRVFYSRQCTRDIFISIVAYWTHDLLCVKSEVIVEGSCSYPTPPPTKKSWLISLDYVCHTTHIGVAKISAGRLQFIVAWMLTSDHLFHHAAWNASAD